MSLINRKIFISGGAGVIGNELCPLLHSLGAIVMVGDLKPRPRHWNSEIIYRQGDLNLMTKEELAFFEPEVFIHLAATFERSTETYEFWEENFRHNIMLSHHLMTISKDLPSMKRVVFASSYLIYNPELYNFAEAQEKPYSLQETDPIYPRNLTGVAKLAHEIELRFIDEFRRDQISIVCPRIYRGYGKGSRCIISRWIRLLLNNEPILVYRPEGMFDYIYAEETAKGLIKLAEHDEIKGIINLGTGRARKVSEVLDVLKRHFPNMVINEGKSDIPFEASQANIELLEKYTGWKPQKQLEYAIPEIIEHERKHQDENEIKDFNVLVTSISRKVPMLKAIKKACNKLGTHIKIFGADANPNCIGRNFVDEFWQMPSIANLTGNDVIQFCKSNHIKAIIPSRDGELQFWSEIKKTLKDQDISVMVSGISMINACIDKLEFYNYFQKLGFPVIETKSDSDLKADSYVVKEQFGAGSERIGINLSKQDADKHAKILSHPIFQPYIAGREISVDAYIDISGIPKGIILRTRDLIASGESQVTTTFEDKKVTELCRSLLHNKGFYGHVVLQLILDKNDNPNIIEINSRFGGASTLSIACGLDSFYWFLLEATGESISNYPFVKSKTIRKQIRFPEDIVI